jgi:Holliday junction DNA helicase RuvB
MQDREQKVASTKLKASEPKFMDAKGIEIERYVAPIDLVEDVKLESSRPELRPDTFSVYIGQPNVKENLKVFVAASKTLDKQLDHVILHGPPGLGKTTLARIIAAELGTPLFETRGPAIDRPGDLAGILTGLKPGSVLFVDEIHRLSIKVEEVLYSAMEDFHLDIIMGQGPAARAMRMPIAPFTLVGATTRLSLLSKPMRDRFGIQERLEFYDESALGEIISRSASILGIRISQTGCHEIARRSRGTPRIANRLLKRVWDFTISFGESQIDRALADIVLKRQGIDGVGLDRIDRLMLRTVFEQYEGGPVGIEALSATLNEDRATLEEVYEPYLVYKGFLARGPRGRILTNRGKEHLRDTQEMETN